MEKQKNGGEKDNRGDNVNSPDNSGDKINAGGTNAKKNSYEKALNVTRSRRTVRVTRMSAALRHLGDLLDRSMPTLLGIAAASVILTLVCGITAFAAVILPDSGGVTRITVPDFTGSIYTEGDADGSLFSVTVDYEYDEGSPAGTVVSQYPQAGAARKVVKGERLCKLTLTLSRGAHTVMLPELARLEVGAALTRLDALGLRAEQREISSADIPRGLVVATSPRALEDVPVGGLVTVYVSLGNMNDTVTVPPLVGFGEATALAKLTALGLEAGKSEYVSSGKPAGTVTAQSLAAGTQVTKGTRVYLTVSLGS